MLYPAISTYKYRYRYGIDSNLNDSVRIIIWYLFGTVPRYGMVRYRPYLGSGVTGTGTNSTYLSAWVDSIRGEIAWSPILHENVGSGRPPSATQPIWTKISYVPGLFKLGRYRYRYQYQYRNQPNLYIKRSKLFRYERYRYRYYIRYGTVRYIVSQQ